MAKRKKKGEKEPSTDPKLERLKAACLDLNKSLDLDPPLEVDDKATVEDLEKEIESLKEDGIQVSASDGVQEDTWSILRQYGVELKGDFDPTAVIPPKTEKNKEEEGTMANKKKEATAKKGTKKEATAKKETKKEATAPKKGKKAGPSNKEVVYKAWKKGTKDIIKLRALVKDAVKEATVKSWLSDWSRDKNLPACANGK